MSEKRIDVLSMAMGFGLFFLVALGGFAYLHVHGLAHIEAHLTSQ